MNPGGRNPAPILFLIIISVVLIVAFIISQKVGELIIKLSEWIITDTISVLVNDSINENIDELGTQYNDIVIFEKDEAGKITALTTNMAYINKLQTKIINDIYATIPDAETEIIYIPVSNIIGSKLLSGILPEIPVKILSVTNVNPSFSNNFSSAGINQTRHQIILNIEIELSVLVPGYTGITTVNTQMIIARDGYCRKRAGNLHRLQLKRRNCYGQIRRAC